MQVKMLYVEVTEIKLVMEGCDLFMYEGFHETYVQRKWSKLSANREVLISAGPLHNSIMSDL